MTTRGHKASNGAFLFHRTSCPSNTISYLSRRITYSMYGLYLLHVLYFLRCKIWLVDWYWTPNLAIFHLYRRCESNNVCTVLKVIPAVPTRTCMNVLRLNPFLHLSKIRYVRIELLQDTMKKLSEAFANNITHQV